MRNYPSERPIVWLRHGGLTQSAVSGSMSTARTVVPSRRTLISVLVFLLLLSAATAAQSPHVLVLYANSRLLPANVQIDDGLREPLGAILSNTDAADLLLQSGADRPEELRAILADIRSDNLRASEVIRRLRALIAKQALGWHPFDLDDALADVKPLLSAEARRRCVTLDFGPVPGGARLMGDRVQVQQVIFNLVLNA
jgi:signal transduction histidine kinase